MIWLGAISYSLYLIHVPIGGRVINLGKRFIDHPWQEFLLSLLALAICLVFATAYHKYVELPAMNWSRQLKKRGNNPSIVEMQSTQTTWEARASVMK